MTYENLSALRWHYFHVRKRTPFYVWLWTTGVINPIFSVFHYTQPLKGPIGHINHNVITERNEWSEYLKKSILWFNQDPLYLLKISALAYIQYKEHLTLWKKIGKEKDWSAHSNVQLIETLQEYVDSILKWDSFIFFHLGLEPYFEQELSKQITPEEYSIATDPIKKGTAALEHENLLKLAIRYKQGKDIIQDLDKHAESFGWLVNNKYDLSFLTNEDYFTSIKILSSPEKELRDEQDHYQEKVKKYHLLLAKYKYDTKIVNLIESAQEAIFFRSFRSERLFQGGIYLQLLLQEIAARISVEYTEIMYLTPSEIISYLNDNKTCDISIIQHRKQGFAYLPPATSGIVVGKELDELSRNIIVFNTNGTEVKGSPAYPGKVQGRTCVVTDLAELAKIKQGDILVCNSTTPDFVPSLRKVLAIVSDEGGILSHAAVISRELKIPAVIGTKYGTKLLKDGDWIEVNATTGTVTILKKA